jgi:hypothetical protein
MTEIAAGDVLAAVHRDGRGRFTRGSVGNPRGITRSKRLARLHRDLMKDYGGQRWLTIGSQILLEQVARLSLELERTRDTTTIARLSGTITRLLSRIDQRPGAPKPPNRFELYIQQQRRHERKFGR